MTERCIVRVKFTLAGGDAAVRRAVGGFLRYVQHRDLHPTQPVHQQSSVSGLVKYVAYRDQASARAELFGWQGLQGTSGRKAFVDFVARSVADSQPQLFRTRDGRMLDRRRAISLCHRNRARAGPAPTASTSTRPSNAARFASR